MQMKKSAEDTASFAVKDLSLKPEFAFLATLVFQTS